MFCPQCRVEYRPGFTRCSDCDVDLVYELPKQESADAELEEEAPPRYEFANGEEYRPLVDYLDSTFCADACLALKGEGIPYRVKELPRGLDVRMESQSEFQLSVPASQFGRAKDLLGIQIAHGEEADYPDGEEIQTAMELPLRDDPPSEATHTDSKSLPWFPEDAIVEVWSGDTRRQGETVELSLRENSIRFRAEARRGQLRIFVIPEDEAKAREIVREIVEGVPPE